MNKKEIKTSKSEVIGQKTLLLTAFIEGSSVIGVELLGAKFIEPYFGSALHTWTSILGITLLGLATGYYSGGVLSKKYRGIDILFKTLGIAALIIAFMPFVGAFVLEFALFTDIRTGAVISSLILIFPPMFCLGMTTPLIIRFLSSEKEQTGKMVGWAYAISTIGGIASAIVLGFLLIPMIGLRICTVIIALITIVIPVIFFLQTKNTKFILTLTSGIILVSGLNIYIHFSEFPKSEHFNVLHQSDGINGRLTVVDYLKVETRALFVNNISQSLEYRPTGRSQWRYVHRIAAYSSFKPIGSKVLLAGLGGGHMVKEFEILGFDIDACDLDSRMEMISKKYFNLSDKVNVFEDDFRHYIRTTDTKYDIIAIDISAGENQPNNLYTLEAFHDMKAVLKEDGVLFVHYPSIYNKPEGLALKSIGTTLKEAGYTVDLINTTSQFDITQEYIYFASIDGLRLSNQDFSRRDTFALPYKFPMYEGVVFVRMKFDKGLVLTDDKPRMDLLHGDIATSYRVQMQPTIKSFLNEGIRFH